MRLAKYFEASRLVLIAAATLIGATFGSTALAQDVGADDDTDTVNVNDPLAAAKKLGVSGDDLRPDDQFTTTLFGRPLIIGGEIELGGQHLHGKFGVKRRSYRHPPRICM